MESLIIIRQALETALYRIECEDYQGTCGCDRRRSGRCGCWEEHNEILAKVQAGLDALNALDVKTTPL